MTWTSFMLGLPLALFLTACGDHLGKYELEDVRLVRVLPADARDGRMVPSRSEYLRVELSSDTSLYAANTGPGLYTDADFCPLRDPNRLIAFGPVASDGKAVENWKRDEELRPNRDRRYHYFVYVASSSPRRKLFANSEDFIPAYDLRKESRDICIRFFVGGYNIIPSRSETVRVPVNILAAATKT